jgi:carbonic anhydrase
MRSPSTGMNEPSAAGSMVSRRGLLRTAWRAGLTAAAVRAVGGPLRPAVAWAGENAPRPTTPDAALARLVAGNKRYAAAHATHPDQTRARRVAVQTEQDPFATVFGCIDSRVPPELVFDEGLGDLLVVRSAGHVLDDVELGSLEFGLEEFHVPLVVVLAHTRCGAIAAATEAASGHLHAPDRVESLTTAIRPAVDDARRQLGPTASDEALRDLTGRLHLERTVARLRATPMFASAVGAGKLRVVGARYALDSGRIEVLVS